MNKNLLIKQNNELFDRIQILKKQNSAMSAEIKKLNADVRNYSKEIEALKVWIAELEAGNIPKTVAVREEQAATENETALTETETQKINEQKEEIVLPEDFTYASDVIGSIVIKAAGFINELTASDNANKKELVNLILGRTEIAKAEILNIVSSDVGFASKQELINTQYDEALEYFKSIMEQ